jgi:hypothetical protein
MGFWRRFSAVIFTSGAVSGEVAEIETEGMRGSEDSGRSSTKVTCWTESLEVEEESGV